MPPDPTDHRLASRSDEQLVAFFALARDRGDEPEMRRIWRQLIVRLHPRVTYYARRTLIAGSPLTGTDLDDAIARAGVKVAFNLVATFNGVSMGELVNATRTLVHFICLDVLDERLRREGRTAALDEPASAADPDGPGRHDNALAAALRAQLERRQEQAGASAQIDAAFARLTNANYRDVLELDRLGVPDPEIATRLDISLDNVYARRSRGLKALRGAFDAGV